MAHSENPASSSPPLVLQPRLIDGKPYVPEPPFSVEKTKIWQSQVLIPFSFEEKTLAFFGPLPTDTPSEIYVDDNEAFFPTSSLTRPLISSSFPCPLTMLIEISEPPLL